MCAYVHALAGCRGIISADALADELRRGHTLDSVLDARGIWHMGGALVVVIHAPMVQDGTRQQQPSAQQLQALQTALHLRGAGIELPPLRPTAVPQGACPTLLSHVPEHAHLLEWVDQHFDQGRLLAFDLAAHAAGGMVIAVEFELSTAGSQEGAGSRIGRLKAAPCRRAHKCTAALMAVRPFGRPVFFVATASEPPVVPAQSEDVLGHRWLCHAHGSKGLAYNYVWPVGSASTPNCLCRLTAGLHTCVMICLPWSWSCLQAARRTPTASPWPQTTRRHPPRLVHRHHPHHRRHRHQAGHVL